MQYINRNISKAISEAIPFFPVITITGPRQSGKTTLCKEMFSDFEYINLEDIKTREQIMRDTQSFIDLYPNGLIIDEVHHYPELFSFIQVTVDADKSRKFVLTGSSNFLLLENITQSLAGRTAIFTLLPLSMDEIRNTVLTENTDAIILKGFYPTIYSYHTPYILFYKNYYATYVERDVRRIVNIKNLKLFQTFIRLCAGRIGTEFNASSLAGEVGVSTPTITEWVTILSASYIAYLLPPYYENISKRLVKSPKIYFYDTGLACYLLSIEEEKQLYTHPLRGSLFENLVVNEAVKNRLNIGKDPNLFFYRDKSQKEVDLIHVKANEIYAYEIKSAKTYHKEFYRGIDYIKGIFNERLTRSALIYDGELEVPTKENGAYNFRNFYLA